MINQQVLDSAIKFHSFSDVHEDREISETPIDVNDV
jgi:hypothetical protein